MTLPYSFGGATNATEPFFRQLQIDLASLDSSISALDSRISALESPYYFNLNRNGTNQVVTAFADSKIQFTNKVADQGSYYDNVTNFRYQPLITGNWFIYLNVRVVGVAGDGPVARIYKNGVAVAEGIYVTSAAGGLLSNVAASVSFNGSTDYVEAFTYSPSVTIIGAAISTFMTGFRIG